MIQVEDKVTTEVCRSVDFRAKLIQIQADVLALLLTSQLGC